MKLLVHVEQYDLVGVLPSQLESLSLVATAMGVTQCAYVDNTADGFSGVGGWTRYNTIGDFLAAESGQFVVLSPNTGEDIRTLAPDPDAWVVLGPSMGFANDAFDGYTITLATVPGGVMNSRDIAPITLWEMSSWREQ